MTWVNIGEYTDAGGAIRVNWRDVDGTVIDMPPGTDPNRPMIARALADTKARMKRTFLGNVSIEP